MVYTPPPVTTPPTTEEFAAQVAAAAAFSNPQHESQPAPAADMLLTPPGELAPPTAPPPVPEEQTLAGQHASQQAAAAAAQNPYAPVNAGSDIALPEAYGEAWKGKSVADMAALLVQTQQELTTLRGTPAAPAQAPPPGGAIPPVVPGTPGLPPVVAPAAAPGTPPAAAPTQKAGDQTAEQQATTPDVLAHYAQKFATSGQLDATDVADITARTGIAQPMVESWVQGQAAIAQLAANQVHNITKGPEGYEALLGWMHNHVPTAGITQFNSALQSNDLARITHEVELMWNAYQQAGGGPPTLFQGRPPTGEASAPFHSMDEVTAAMNKLTPDGQFRQYDVDESYRNQVDTRLARSNV